MNIKYGPLVDTLVHDATVFMVNCIQIGTIW